MKKEQIEHMVNRFLGWALPENFRPDCGITFERFHAEGTPRQIERKPVGTNLLDYQQATAMVEYMVSDLPENNMANIAINSAQPDILRYFAFSHLPDKLKAVSEPFGKLAADIVKYLPDNEERAVALRKLLEAKDCAVRAIV